MDLRHRGYMGKILHVDLTSGDYHTEELEPRLARMLLGGKGIGTFLLMRELKAGVDPLSVGNVLIIGTGPLNGALSPSSGRFAVFTKSPTTGTYLDSYCGGPFGNALKRAGYDFLIVKGRAPEPSVLVIDENGVHIEPAGDLWGKLTTETTSALKERLGTEYETAVIGPAGERLSPIAGILSDLRIAARGGVGAVMGAKKLKAMAATGTRDTIVFDEEEFSKNAWIAFRSLRMSAEVQRLTKDGTPNILGLINASGGLPARNFQQGTVDQAEELEGQTWRKKRWVQNIACANCPISCSKIGIIQSGKHKGVKVDGPEYETIFSLGTNCAVTDHDAIMAVNHLADVYGVDSISLGGIIAFVMELYDKGIVSADDLDGIGAEWGSGAALTALGEKICQGDGIGSVLEKGVKRLSEENWPESRDFAMHVKGLEMPAYLPRAAKGIALAYAISERGACHLHGAPIGELLGSADPLSYEDKARLVRSKQLDVAIIDSTVHCYFTDFGMSLKEVYQMLRPCTGFDYSDIRELEQIADRIITLTRLFNLREGFTRADDTLPGRCTREPVPVGPAAGETVDLERLLDEYYKVMNWDTQGRPTEESLADLRINELVQMGLNL